MNVRKKQKIKMTLILLTILLPITLFSMIFLNQGNRVGYSKTATDGDINHVEVDGDDNYFPEISDITHINDKYDLSLW